MHGLIKLINFDVVYKSMLRSHCKLSGQGLSSLVLSLQEMSRHGVGRRLFDERAQQCSRGGRRSRLHVESGATPPALGVLSVGLQRGDVADVQVWLAGRDRTQGVREDSD